MEKAILKLNENGLHIKTEFIDYNISGVTDFCKKVKYKGTKKEVLSLKLEGIKSKNYIVFKSLPIIHIPNYKGEEILTLNTEHTVLKTIKLHAFTDEIDTLVEENEYNIFYKKLLFSKNGEIFVLKNYQDNTATFIISETPDYQTTELFIKDGKVSLKNNGYALTIGFCGIDEYKSLIKKYYNLIRGKKTLISMSNTWGDRNGITRICRDFALKEIDAAKEIGVDIVQIDDGWQVGKTYDTSKWDEKNRPVFKGDFWQIDKNLFPKELKEVTEYASSFNVKTGIWFAPDAHDNYALFDRDVEVLKKAYFEWGVRFFKLDMYWITNKKECKLFLKLLKVIHSFGKDVAVQLDVTRNRRINYFCGKEYGTLFVENRYTKGGTYFPHRTLRNLWSIAQYLPANKFQFEITNPDLNGDFYLENDLLKPSLYDMDYLFASVMLSNPLFWMEMQYLSDKRKDELKRIIPIWNEIKKDFSVCEAEPILQKPSGRSISGFKIKVNNKDKYLLIFRETTNNDTATIKVNTKSPKVLATNTEVELNCFNDLQVKLNKEKSYALIKL